MTPARPDRLVQTAAARMKEPTPTPARPVTRVSRRPDLSAPFTVTLMIGLMSAGLFLSGSFQHDVPLAGILLRVFVDPFGAMAMALLATAGVMARIGDI